MCPLQAPLPGLFSGDEPYDVTKELQKFAKVVYTFDSSGHSPRRVQLTWGKLVFEGVLGSLSLNYKLFGPDGSPLRVEARATFEGSISDMLRELEENKNSPDLTHVRKVVAGDNILLMSNYLRHAGLLHRSGEGEQTFQFQATQGRKGDLLSSR